MPPLNLGQAKNEDAFIEDAFILLMMFLQHLHQVHIYIYIYIQILVVLEKI